ncbi:tripartite tricarboxylate transporter substrate binding protein [Xylophilus rhododendri]|uniref:Tripartite tricarboxylate transporter substrate binding protein n=1 Tax=Xylophilus rhododendri TaxID=2697032 RepID=A0A857JCJ4_9BURK|nr:tripartite tricarboxylate transporter substrate binding protein [Xylophilus rhododendri]QHJ01731.1 tripartite tricarboxylate transporter substrate binding protein [Xylophilus rhododendri]
MTSLLARRPALAQPDSAYPQRQIRIVVGYPPGQTVDVTARAFAAALQQSLGQAVFVDNKPGANGILGAQTVKAAEADGYTLLFGTSGQMAINPALYARLPYDTLKDFTPIGMGATGRSYLVVNNALPVKSLAELVAYSKAHPGKLSYGSGGAGITAHLAMEILKSDTGMDALHVPYKGSPAAVTGLLAGDVQAMFDAGAVLMPLIRSGKVRVLAVSSKERFSGLPEVPTVAEQGFAGFEVAAWTAMFAPAATPPAIVEKLNAAMQAATRQDALMAPIRAGGSEPQRLSVAQMRQFMPSEIAKWGRAAAAAGVKPE